MRGRTTPGPAGYLLAVLVSIGVTALGLAVSVLVEAGPGQAAAAFVVCLVYVTLFAAPIAPVGVLLVHLACRGVASQRVHVLAAGIAGVVTGVVFSAVIDVGSGVVDSWPLAAALGIGTAVGRASVIGLVPAVRARRQAVDGDFRPEPAAR